MGIGAKEAAELVGMSKAGIIKAIRTGKISAEKDVHGEWQIEPVELFRVYPAVHSKEQPSVDSTAYPTVENTPENTPSTQQEAALLREIIQRQDKEIQRRDEVIDNLLEQLAVEAEERRKLALLLPELRSGEPAVAASASEQSEVEKPKGFWRRLLRI